MSGGGVSYYSSLNIVVLTADNGIIGHLLEVLSDQDISASSGGDKDLTNAGSLLHRGDLVARDGSLEGVDGVDFGNKDTSTHSVKSHSTALSDITETCNNSDLTSDHDISGTLDTIDQRFTATIQVIELRFGDGVVDVHSGDKEGVVLHHLVQVVNTGGGLLGDTVAALQHLGVLLVNESSEISTVIEDQVQALAILERNELLLQAPLVLLLSLSLPREDRDTYRISVGSRIDWQSTHRQQQWQRQRGPGY
jgi:hypothetical protein